MSAKVRTSPVSKTASILIVVLGLFTLLAGLTTGIIADIVAGVAFLVLGLFLYRMLFWFNRKVEREMREA